MIKDLEKIIIGWPQQLRKFFLAITVIGGLPALISLAVFLILSGFYFKQNLMIKVAASSLIVILLNRILKRIFAKERPISDYSKRFKSYSFPSDHAAGSSISYLNLAYLVCQYWTISPILLYGAALALILVICLSRVYLKAHYLIDVLAGFTFGVSCFIIISTFIY